MKRALAMLAFVVVSGCASTPSPELGRAAPSRSSASTIVVTSALATFEAESQTSVTCTLPADVCGDAIRAVESVPALNSAGMPPVAVAILDWSRCRSVSGAPKGFDPCAASLSVPPSASATGGGDGIATVTYRNGLGKAFLYVWWWTFASGRGPINVALEAHNP